jgi:PAS domain S-box-containing protein
MEMALRESEARWNFALEGSGDGVWDWNSDTNEVYYSKNWKFMLGYDEHEIGTSLNVWDSRIHPDDKTGCYEDLNKHMRGEMEIYHNEHRLLCKDGKYKWILDRGKVVAWKSDGQPLRMIGTHSDISKRKEFEESLRSAIAKEKELNDLKSRFVSMASHEFRTPMASILMMSDSLISYWKRMDDDHIALKLTHIKDQVQHLAQVVTDVMQVAKIQEGKLSYAPKRMDIVGLAADVIKDFNIDDSLITKIKFDSKWTSLDMLLDSRLMLQVLNNLLSNAIKYSLPTPVVLVKLYEKGDEILLAIKDNGIGIPKRETKNLFQPFYRAENVKQIQGNGLGLNIAKESVMLHGGDITFTSELWIGSTFVVHLPKTLILTL